MRRLSKLVVAFAIAAVPLAALAAERPIRVHAIGYKQLLSDADPDDVDSYGSYRNHLVRLADDAIAADQEAPPDSQRVFVFPEDSALYAMFIGARGLPLRTLEPLLRQGGGNGGSVAIAGLFAAYQAQAAYYRVKFPAQNLSQARLGLLALTDTLYRSFFETFCEIAIRHRAWVVTSANVAPAEIVTDPLRAALLGDPEGRERPCGDVPAPCAYEATSESVYNQAFVFDPGGRLVFNPRPESREGELDGAVKKTYLVPVEQGPIERGKIGLDLAYGDLRQVRPIAIAGVPMGIVISKPAWMLDELGRLEAYDTQVILQPEAFSSWAVPEGDDPSWSPDVLKQSGWSHTQKYSPFRYSILAELTGNFFDLIFDAQNHIVKKATRKLASAPRYIGQPDDVGWVAVSPWVVSDDPDDPSSVCTTGDLRVRRECLALYGEKLAPASNDPLENQYMESTIAATLDLSRPARDEAPRVPGALGNNAPLDLRRARQRNPRAATGPDGTVYVVWEDRRSGVDQIRIARISPSGAIESRRVLPSGTRQIFPQVAVASDGTIHVVWQELGPRPRIVRTSAPGWNGEFFPFAFPIPFFPVEIPFGSSVTEQWKPAVAIDGDDRLHVAWIGLVDGFERLLHTRIDPDGNGFSESTGPPLDAEAFPAPDPLAERLNNRWNPAIAARTFGDGSTKIAIAWTDFRNYAWDLFATVSADGGETFDEHVRVDDAGAALERLHNDPSVLISPGGAVNVAWTDQAGRRAGCAECPKQRRPDADIAFARLGDANIRIDDTGDGLTREDHTGFSNQWRPALAADSATGRVYAVWQDHREGNNDIYLSYSDDGGTSWAGNVRVDDTGGGPSNQTSPVVTVAGGTLTVLWQDDRDGREQIYYAQGGLE